jgi:hypothetical protein
MIRSPRILYDITLFSHPQFPLDCIDTRLAGVFSPFSPCRTFSRLLPTCPVVVVLSLSLGSSLPTARRRLRLNSWRTYLALGLISSLPKRAFVHIDPF